MTDETPRTEAAQIADWLHEHSGHLPLVVAADGEDHFIRCSHDGDVIEWAAAAPPEPPERERIAREAVAAFVWERLEATPGFNEEIAQALADVKAGRVYRWEDVKRRLDEEGYEAPAIEALRAAPPETPRPDLRLRHLAETIVCFCNDPKLVAEAEELLRELDAAGRKHSKVTARVHRSTAKFIKKYRTTLRDLEQSDGSAASPDALRWDGTEYDER